MKIFYKFFFIFIFIFIFSKNSLSAEKIAFINIDLLVKNSIIGKKTLNNIQILDKKNISILEKKNNDLMKLENNIQNKKNVITKADFDKEVENFQKKIKLFSEEKNKIVNDFNNYRKLEIDKIFRLFNPIITKYMEENNFGILLDSKNIFMGKGELDITNDVLNIINQELK